MSAETTENLNEQGVRSAAGHIREQADERNRSDSGEYSKIGGGSITGM